MRTWRSVLGRCSSALGWGRGDGGGEGGKQVTTVFHTLIFEKGGVVATSDGAVLWRDNIGTARSLLAPAPLPPLHSPDDVRDAHEAVVIALPVCNSPHYPPLHPSSPSTHRMTCVMPMRQSSMATQKL